MDAQQKLACIRSNYYPFEELCDDKFPWSVFILQCTVPPYILVSLFLTDDKQTSDVALFELMFDIWNFQTFCSQPMLCMAAILCIGNVNTDCHSSVQNLSDSPSFFCCVKVSLKYHAMYCWGHRIIWLSIVSHRIIIII